MTMLRTAGLTLAFLFASTSARADEISDEQDACRSADKGVECTVRGVAGTCQDSKCSRIDYSGDKPKSVERDCRTCVVHSGSVMAAAPTKAEVPVKAEVPAKAGPTAEVPAKAEPAPAKSGCAVEPGPLSLGTIPLGIVLVALARRRRR